MYPIRHSLHLGGLSCPFYEDSGVRRVVAITSALMAAASAALLYLNGNSSSVRIEIALRGALGVCSLLSMTLINLPYSERDPAFRIYAYNRALQAPNLALFIEQNKPMARAITVTPELRAKMEGQIPNFETLKHISAIYGGGFWSNGWVSDSFVFQKGVEYLVQYADPFLGISHGQIPVKIYDSLLPNGALALLQEAKAQVKRLTVYADGQIQAAYTAQQREEETKKGIEDAKVSIAQDVKVFEQKRDEIKAQLAKDLDAVKTTFLQKLNAIKPRNLSH